MGGSIGNTIGRVGSGIFTLGGSEIARNNLPSSSVANQLLNAPGTILTGGQYNPGSIPFLGSSGQSNPYVSGPFSLDPNQLAGDQAALTGLGTKQQGDINALAQQQYDQTLKQIPSEVSNAIQQENPSIMENLNSSGLLNSSAYPQEIARQQSYLTQNLVQPAIASLQAGQQSGLNTLQGLQTGATQRGLSLEDQINNANISKTIGQAFAPQPPTGKQNFGTAAQGIGALAPWGKTLAKAGGTAVGAPAGAAVAGPLFDALV